MKRNFYPVMGDDNYPEYLSVISSQKCGRIKIDDIEVIEQEGRKIHIVTAERDYAIYESISGIIPAEFIKATLYSSIGIFLVPTP